MDLLRVGIVGIGNMGGMHMQNILDGKISNMQLTAICDIDEQKIKTAKEKYGIAVFQKYEDLLSSKLIDAVIIATPHYLHPVIAIKAFENNLHVLTEKPAGVRSSDVLKMNTAAQKSGKVFGIMWNQRTNLLFQKAKEIIDGGVLGTPKRLVWIITNWYRTQSYYNSASWRATWAGEGGGVLLNQAPHNLDLWQWIFGMPDEISAECGIGKWHNIEVEDDVTITAGYKNGATATFITSTGEYPGTNRLEISGSKGKMVLEKGILKLSLTDEDERDFCFTDPNGFPSYNITETEFEASETEKAHNGILQNFTNAVLFGDELLAPGYEGIKEITLSNAAYLSAWTGKKIILPMDNALFDALLEEKIKNSSVKNTQKKEAESQPCRWQVRW